MYESESNKLRYKIDISYVKWISLPFFNILYAFDVWKGVQSALLKNWFIGGSARIYKNI